MNDAQGMVPKSKQLLFLGYVWPEATSSAAGVRTWSLLNFFLQEGWQIKFVSPSKQNDFTVALKKAGIETHSFDANDSSFDSFVEEWSPDVAIFDRFVMEEQFGWRVKDSSPRTLRIVDTQDLHFLRRARSEALKRGAPISDISRASFDLQTEDSYREVASLYRSDLSLVLSSFEHALLLERFQFPPDLLYLMGFAYPSPDKKTSPGFHERKGYGWIGNFRHPPNLDGVLWMLESLWPRIRKLHPGAELSVYGAYPPKEITQKHSPENGVWIKGWVEDAGEALRKHRVNLVPLRFGAGIKGKIAEGWSVGTPAVSTPLGSEGMEDSGDWGGTVALEEEEWVEAAIQMEKEQALWESSRQEGYRLLETLFSYEGEKRKFLKHLNELLSKRDSHRQKNFVGSMLWHHQFRSTTYFSKWIELKNQRKEEN